MKRPLRFQHWFFLVALFTGSSIVAHFAPHDPPAQPDTFTPAPRLSNFSARGLVTATHPQWLGYVVRGEVFRPALLRCTGLGVFPLLAEAQPVLTEPDLTLFHHQTIVGRDRASVLDPHVQARTAEVGAWPIIPHPYDPAFNYGSALATVLYTGTFTARASSGDGRSGLNLFEFYDSRAPSRSAEVRNVSLRGWAGTGHEALIAGFVISGEGRLRLLIRGIGPGLRAFGLSPTVADATIHLYRGRELLASNDNWGGAAAIRDVVARLGAFPLPDDSLDAALLVELDPGAYTVVLRPQGAPAEGMVELYLAD